MSEGSSGKGKASARVKSVIATIGVFSGAIATIVVALIADKSGALYIAVGGTPSPVVTTITPRAAPTVTVTASPVPTAPGPITLPSCPQSQGCRAYNVVARLGANSTGITFSTGAVTFDVQGDMNYLKSQDGTLELMGYLAMAYSTGVTAQSASRQGCQNLTTSDPDPDPIINLHAGLLFCVATGGLSPGIALVKQTRPIGANKVLYLTELYWPDQTSG
jgi:hypothetical protein